MIPLIILYMLFRIIYFANQKLKKKKHFPAQYCSIKRPELPFLQYQKLCRSMLARSPIYNLGLDALIYFGVFLRLLIKFYPPKSVTLCKESINELFVGNQIQLRKKWLGTIWNYQNRYKIMRWVSYWHVHWELKLNCWHAWAELSEKNISTKAETFTGFMYSKQQTLFKLILGGILRKI